MLFAELANKLGRNSERAHERGEDLLTSTVFQLLRYMSPDQGLFSILRRVRFVHRTTGNELTYGDTWQLPMADDYELKPWPRHREHGEPDMVVTLKRAGVPVAGIVIEIKLDACKSGRDESDEPNEQNSRDQLRKYWHWLQSGALTEAPTLGVAYLTADAVPPTDDLISSLRASDPPWLGWLSWYDVASVLQHTLRGRANAS